MDTQNLKSKIEAKIKEARKDRSDILSCCEFIPFPQSYHDLKVEIRTLEKILEELEKDSA